jgi:hypothetical protein
MSVFSYPHISNKKQLKKVDSLTALISKVQTGYNLSQQIAWYLKFMKISDLVSLKKNNQKNLQHFNEDKL